MPSKEYGHRRNYNGMLRVLRMNIKYYDISQKGQGRCSCYLGKI